MDWILEFADDIHAINYFSSAAKVFDPSNLINEMNNYLGFEFDIALGVNLAKFVSLNAGYSQMFASKTMEAIKGGDNKTINN